MDKNLLKKKLHAQIDTLDDELSYQMLHEAATEYGKKEDAIDELTPEQLEKLTESIAQLDNGQWKSHEDVMKLAKTWLEN